MKVRAKLKNGHPRKDRIAWPIWRVDSDSARQITGSRTHSRVGPLGILVPVIKYFFRAEIGPQIADQRLSDGQPMIVEHLTTILQLAENAPENQFRRAAKIKIRGRFLSSGGPTRMGCHGQAPLAQHRSSLLTRSASEGEQRKCLIQPGRSLAGFGLVYGRRLSA